MGKKENVEIALNVSGADESVVDVKKLEKAFDGLGDEATKIQTPVLKALDAIQAKFAKATSDMASVTQRDVNSMAKNFNVLEQEIKQAFGSTANAPLELQQALQKAENQLTSTTRRFGQMSDAVKDNSAAAKIAGDNWTGLGSAMEAMGGKAGSAAARVGVISAALREGIQLGHQFNKFAQTDMTEYNQMMDVVGKKTGGVLSGIFDHFVAVGRVTKAAFSTDADKLIKELAMLGDESAQLEDVVKHLGVAIREETEAEKAAIEAAKAAEEATKKLADAKKDAAKAATDAATAYLAENEKMKAGFDLMEGNLKQKDQERDLLEKLAEKEQAATQVKDGLADSTRKQLDIVKLLLPNLDQHTGKIDDIADALRVQVKTYEDGLTPAMEKRLTQLADELDKYTAGDAAAKRRIESLVKESEKTTEASESTIKGTGSLKDHTLKIENVVESSTKLTGALASKKATITNVKEATEQSTVALQTHGDKQSIVSVAIKKTGDAVDSNTKLVNFFRSSLFDANAEMAKIASSASAAAGGIDIVAEAAKRATVALNEMARAAANATGGPSSTIQ